MILHKKVTLERSVQNWNFFLLLISLLGYIGVASGGQRGHAPQIFRKYSNFVLWEPFFQTK